MRRFRKFMIIIGIIMLLFGCSAQSVGTANKLLIYYGTPMGINDVWDIREATHQLAKFDTIVLAEGLEQPSDENHESTKTIISQLKKMKPEITLFGYVNLDMIEDRLSEEELQDAFHNWKAIGVDGIFLDCAGYDYDVSRERFNTALQSVHNLDMKAFVNAWDPDDVMGDQYHPLYNSDTVPSNMRAGDYYLLEKFLLPYDITNPMSPTLFSYEFIEKMDKVIEYRKQLGIKMFAVSRIDYSEVSDRALTKFFRMNEAAAGVFSLDGYGVSPVEYSSSLEDEDIVKVFPYMANYMRYYTTNVQYRITHDDQQFSRDRFVVHSTQGYHIYNTP